MEKEYIFIILKEIKRRFALAEDKNHRKGLSDAYWVVINGCSTVLSYNERMDLWEDLVNLENIPCKHTINNQSA